MKLFKAVMATVVLVSTIGTASAQRDFAEIYKECGLGALLFPDDPIIAVVTNVTWDLGTTAVLSELSTPENCKGNSAMMASLVIDAHPQLEQDLAIGEGDYLASMVDLMGCEGTEVQAASALRAQFSQAASTGTYFEMDDYSKAEALYNAALTTSANVCSI
jgi:hypothetical protein